MSNRESETEYEERDENACGSTFVELLKLCAGCCYVACPPVPELISRKLAFHPPIRGKTYSVHLKADEDKFIRDARCLAGDPFAIKQRQHLNILTREAQLAIEEHIDTFTVRQAFGNHLICVRARVKRKSCSIRVSDQVILFVQPNSSDLGGFLHPLSLNFPHLAEILETDVYAFDYSGYGYSSGNPSEKNIYADIEAVYDYIREKRPDKKIVLMGYSLGTSAVVHMASTRPSGLAGVVLIAPFTSGLRLFANNPHRDNPCCLDRFRSVDKIAAIDVPTLICHGTNDPVIPSSHALALHSRLSHPVAPLLLYGADHLTILSGEQPQTYTRIYRFLRTETMVDDAQTANSPSG